MGMMIDTPHYTPDQALKHMAKQFHVVHIDELNIREMSVINYLMCLGYIKKIGRSYYAKHMMENN